MDFLQQNWQWALLLIASATFLIVDTIRSIADKTTLSPGDATRLINREDAVVLDVREHGEYVQGHIPNARHVPLSEFDARLQEIDKLKSSPVIVCCASGNRSRTAIAKLQKAGFEKAFNLKGGVAEWEKSGQPLTTGRKPKGKK